MTAPAGRLGSAFVQIRADARRFAREARRSINNGLADIEDYLTRGRFPNAVRRAGAQAGRDFARMFNLFASRINIDIDRDKLLKFGGQFLKIFGALGAAANSLAAAPGILSAIAAGIGTIGAAAAATLPALIAGFIVVSQTFGFALKGVGEAMKAIADEDAAALEEALKDLAPAAQSFVREIAAAQPEMKRLQQQIQQSFFQPLVGGFQDLIRSGFLDLIRERMSEIATLGGLVAREFLDIFTGSVTDGRLGKILEGVRDSFAQLTLGLPNLADAFLSVAAAAAPFIANLLGGLPEAIGKLGDRLKEFADSGGVVQLFQRVGDIVQTVVSTLGDLFAIVGAVFGSLLSGANGAVGPLSAVLETVRGFVESQEGAAVLDALGRALQGVGNIVSAVLKPLLPVVGKLIATLAGPLANILERLLRPIARLAEDLGVLFGHVIEGAAPILEKVIDLLLQFGIDILGQVAKHIEEMTPVLTELMEELGPHLIPIVEALGEVLVAFLPVLPAVTEAMVELAPVIIELIPVMVFMAKVTAGLWQGIAVLVRFIVLLVTWVGKMIASQFTSWLKFVSLMLFEVWPRGLQFLRDAWLKWVGTLVQGSIDVVKWVGEALSKIGTWLAELPGRIKGWLAGLGSALASPFVDAFRWVQNAVATGIQNLINAIGSIPGRIASWASSIFNAAAGIGRAIGNGIANIPGFAVDIAGRIVGAIRNFTNNVIYSINVGIARLDNLIPFSLPQIPYLAKGAIVDSPTLAVIGERGREVVLPLNDPARAQQLAEESGLLGLLSGIGGEQPPPTVNVYIGDEPITERVKVVVQRTWKAQSRELAYGARA